jgi:hypothetical protein
MVIMFELSPKELMILKGFKDNDLKDDTEE